MTDDELKRLEQLFSEELERLVAEEEWRRSPEGRAEEARIDAEVEAHLEEMAAFDAEMEAKFAALKEKMND
jgi:hypothetical protein